MADIRQRFVVEVDGGNKLTVLAEGMETVSAKAKNTQSELEKFKQSMKDGLGLGAGISAANLASNAILGLANSAKQAVAESLKFADEMDNLAARTGMSASALQAYEFAATRAGASLDTLLVANKTLAQVISEQPEKLERYGLSWQKLAELSPEDRMNEVAEAIGKLPTALERSAAAQDLFGSRAGDVMAGLLPEWEANISAAEEYGLVVSDEAIEALDRFGDRNDVIFARLKKGWNEALASTLTYAEAALKALANGGTLTTLGIGIAVEKAKLDAEIAANVQAKAEARAADRAGAAERISAERREKERKKAAEKATKEREREAQENQRIMDKFYQDQMKHDEEAYIEAEKLREKTKKDEEEWFKVRLKADGEFHRDAQKTRDEWAKGADEKLKKQVASWTEQLKRFGKLKFADPAAFDAWDEALSRTAEKFGNMASFFGTLREGFQALGVSADSFAMSLVVGLEAGAKAAQTMAEARRQGDTLGMVSAGAGAVMSAYSGASTSTAKSALSGAATGAMAGSAFGPIGAAVGGVIGGIAGIFGSKKKREEEKKKALEEFKALEDKLKAQFGSMDALEKKASKYGVALKKAMDAKDAKALEKQLQELEKRMRGLQTATDGVIQLIEALTFQDAEGNILSTFTDPKVIEATAGTFSSIFWEVYRKEGAAALDKLAPAYEKLRGQMLEAGLDPSALLGDVERIMAAIQDPKTKALLSASSAGANILRGSMEGGFMSDKMLADQTTIARATLEQIRAQGLDANAMADQLAALAEAYKATGQELPDDLRAAMEEAGLEALDTQVDLLRDIRDILKGGDSAHAAKGYGPKYLDRDTMIAAHQGELVSVIPAHKVRTMQYRHLARGTDDIEREEERRGGGGGGVYTPSETSPTTTSSPVAQVESALEALAEEIRSKPAAEPVTQVFNPTFKIDPLQTKESREELGRHLTEQFLRDLRNNPTVQYAVQRAARTR